MNIIFIKSLLIRFIQKKSTLLYRLVGLRLQQDKMCWSSAPNPDLEVKQCVNSDGDMLMFVLIYSRTKTIAQLIIYSCILTKLYI